jgi:hypothetical protein
MPKVDEIYFYLGRKEAFVVFSEGDKHLKVYNLDMDTEIIKNQVREIEERKDYTYYYSMKDTLGVDNNIYITYKMAQNLPKVYVKNELDIYDIDEIRNII